MTNAYYSKGLLPEDCVAIIEALVHEYGHKAILAVLADIVTQHYDPRSCAEFSYLLGQLIYLSDQLKPL